MAPNFLEKPRLWPWEPAGGLLLWVNLKRSSRPKYLVLIFNYRNHIIFNYSNLIATPKRWKFGKLLEIVNVDLSIVSHSHVTMDVTGQEWEDTAHHTATIKHLDLPAKMGFDRFFETHYSLVVWNMNLIFPEYMGMSSSQLTKSYFSEGWVYHQPGNSWIWGKHGRRRATLAARGSRGGETRTKRMASDQSIFISDIAGPQTRIEKYKNSGKMW